MENVEESKKLATINLKIDAREKTQGEIEESITRQIVDATAASALKKK